ncbi:MAG: response regulator [candidate division Zixibacteria bacterium]|nr:response regulator [candidate division Zixibacteria bacterium]
MSPNNQNINILVVDDEKIVVSLVSDALEDEGFNLKSASNGEEALKILENYPLDLLITDIRMSPINGIELAQKAREKYSEAKVIFITGYANLNSAKDAIKYGAVDYIMKPFELTEIRQSVSKAVRIINENIEKKASAHQLDSLSDLNQLLYTVGDKKSLINISLRFSIMQLKGKYGSIIRWDKEQESFHVHKIIENKINESRITDELVIDKLKNCNLNILKSASIIDRNKNHPLQLFYDDSGVCSACSPADYVSDELQLVAIPVKRIDDIYGLILVTIEGENTSAFDSDLKLLSITASQLAISLENLNLLEETQKAYSRLQELQTETIELEKMAAKGEISAEIGHELNNFLGVFAGNLSLLDIHIQKQNYGKVDKYLTSMKDNIENIKKFTSNLMDLRTISSDKEIIMFDKLLEEVIEYLKPQKRFDKIKIDFQPCGQEIPFNADSTHIQQLLYNLFNNAADAMIEKDIKEISVATNIIEGENSFKITIKDTGVGFDPENLKKAFQSKFTTKPTGHGFGLLVCNRIIESHDGHLHIDSIPGEGTTMSIDFPTASQKVSEPSLA